MKLTSERLEFLTLYLESKRVYHWDLKQELLDHMATSIEVEMETNGTNFNDAFEMVCNKWHNELQPYSNMWLGNGIKEPKIVLMRYLAIIKKMYRKTLALSLAISGILFLFLNNNFLNIVPLYPILGIAYLFILLTILLVFFKMAQPRLSTTSKGLFKATMGYYFAWLLVFNPLFTKLYWVFQEGQLITAFLFIHVFLLCFSINFIWLFKTHVKVVRMNAT